MAFKIGCLDYTFSYMPFPGFLYRQGEFVFSALSKLKIVSYHRYLKKSLFLISSLGFSGAQVMCTYPQKMPLKPSELRIFCDALSLDVVSLGGYWNLLGINWAHFKSSLDYGADACVNIVCTHSGNGSDWLLLEERLLELCDYASERGVTVALENSPLHLVKNTEDMLRISKSVKKLRFNLDPANLNVCGCDVVSAVKSLGKRIVHVHAKDSLKNSLIFPEIGKGDVDFKSFFSALRKIHYNGYLVVEYEGSSDPLEAVKNSKLFIENSMRSVV